MLIVNNIFLSMQKFVFIGLLNIKILTTQSAKHARSIREFNRYSQIHIKIDSQKIAQNCCSCISLPFCQKV